MRTQYCREHIKKTAEECDLGQDIVSEVEKVDKFCKSNPAFAGCGTRPLYRLISVRDESVKNRAISLAQNALIDATPTGGTIQKRLTEPEIKKLIQKAEVEIRGEKEKEPLPVEKERAPKKPSFNGTPQPGDFRTGGPVPPVKTLAEITSGQVIEPEHGVILSEAYCRTKKCEQLKPCKERGNRLECFPAGAEPRHMSECPIEKRQRLAKEQGFGPASDIDPHTGGRVIKMAPVRITKSPEVIHFEPSPVQWDYINRARKELDATPAEFLSALIDTAMLQEGV
jgi:hypothetical protein